MDCSELYLHWLILIVNITFYREFTFLQRYITNYYLRIIVHLHANTVPYYMNDHGIYNHELDHSA